MTTHTNYTWGFFGSSDFSIIVLDELASRGLIPTYIVTTEDKPKGRKLVLTPPEVKVWAEQHSIPYVQLKTLRKDESVEAIKSMSPNGSDVFVVASYGKIIPQSIIDIPRRGVLNVHPSLLPKLRGASPIQSSLLTEIETGVTIMQIDADMDHGPLLAQEKIISWDGFMENKTELPYSSELKDLLGKKGAQMLADVFVPWIENQITAHEQNHALATVCGKIEKEDGKIDLTGDPETNLRKIHAFHQWPGAYYIHHRNGKDVRVIVKKARIENRLLVLERVVPEGKKEMDYADFIRGER
ncbi:MAG: methionyl-tRNA formyltransferase [Patescibacteria group bacterium]|nr:methionyl-tRNA formyltransferase [Patescibacteria group bacterium]